MACIGSSPSRGVTSSAGGLSDRNQTRPPARAAHASEVVRCELGARRDLTRDVREHLADLRARERHGAHADQRDQRDEERVLEKVLTFFVTNERTQTVDKLHCCPPARPQT